MGMSIGGMIVTGENWSTGKETLYSVGGRWINGYGTLVEWYWQGKSEVLGEKHYIVWVVGEWMGKERWWNDTDRGKLKYWEGNLCSRCSWPTKGNGEVPNTKQGWQHSAGTNCLKMANIWESTADAADPRLLLDAEDLSKRREVVAQRHSVTSQNSGVFSSLSLWKWK